MSAGGSLHAAMQPPYQQGGNMHMYGGVVGKVLSETTRPFDGSAPQDVGSLPLLVQHSSSLQAPQPAGHLIPTNVRPPQCLAAAAVGSAYIPSSLTGSPFFHAAPSAPPCISRNPQAPTLAALTHRLGAPGLLGDSELGGPHQQQQQQGGMVGAARGPSGSTGGSDAPEGVCWPPPNTVSVGYGNIRSQMEVAGAGLAQNNCVLAGNSNKAFSVISIPNQQAALYNRAAEELSRSLKAMGCYAAKNPAAATLSRQLLFAKQQNQNQRKPQNPRDENAEAAAAAAAAAAEAERQQREAEEAAARAQEEEQQKQQNLEEIDVSQLLCLAGPSPAQLREMRAKEAEMWRQQQQQQQQQQQMEYQQQQQQQQRFYSDEDYYRQQQQQQQYDVQDSWSEGDAAPAYLENPVNEYGQQTDRDYLREQILLQEERIAQLHEQLMQHQQTREQRRQEAAAAAAAAATTVGDRDAQGGFFLPEEHHVASKADTRQPNQQQQQQQQQQEQHEFVRRASGSTKWSSRQSSDDRPKNQTVDSLLEAYLRENGLSPSLFRRVRSGVYFYGKTKLVMKIQRGQLSCMALHLTHEQQQTQQARFVCIDRFLKEQGALNVKA
ncbi:hypothetical protein Emed_003603 [Eimeria media]